MQNGLHSEISSLVKSISSVSSHGFQTWKSATQAFRKHDNHEQQAGRTCVLVGITEKDSQSQCSSRLRIKLINRCSKEFVEIHHFTISVKASVANAESEGR